MGLMQSTDKCPERQVNWFIETMLAIMELLATVNKN